MPSRPPRSGGFSGFRAILLQPNSVPPGASSIAPPAVPDAPAPPKQEAVTTDVSPPAALEEQLWSGRFRVTEEVGRGAMSVVVRATDTKLRRDLALKVCPLPREQLSVEQLARFVEEAQITAQLEHPNVVPVHDIGLDPEGRAYFSMKLIRGQSLADIFDKLSAGDASTAAEFGLRRLLDVFLQTCQAVEYAHARGVIHRDLKPANIMVGDFGEVLVMDWGVAKLVGQTDSMPNAAVSEPNPDPLSSRPSLVPGGVTSVRAGKRGLATHLGTVIGTPAYMSPEQASGLAVDEKADIYALGVILYQILCGEVPFDHDDPNVILDLLRTELPMPPSALNPAAPRALETLALQMLEKLPERRLLTLRQIRAHVLDYIEGFGRDYRRESLWSPFLRFGSALGMFAFFVWYLTGKSIAAVLALAPASVLNAVGWLLFVIALRYPLWAVSTSLSNRRAEYDRFREPDRAELFASGYAARRSFAAAVAPIFGLSFVAELVWVAFGQATHAGRWGLIGQITDQLRTGWANALISMLVCLFAYLVFFGAEVRFARRIERYALLIVRPAWESVWPALLIVVLLLSITATGLLDWMGRERAQNALGFSWDRVIGELNLFDIVKTLVFQGTFLVGLVMATLLDAFPFAEVLAALRLPYQAADQASVASRPRYFLRSMACFRMARAAFLYGGAMIGCLTAITILSRSGHQPIMEQVLYISGPSLVGFAGFWFTRRFVLRYLAHTPAVRTLLDSAVAEARQEHEHARREKIRAATWRLRMTDLVVPVVCVFVYLLWTGSSVDEHTLRELVLPVSMKGWLIILPYAMLLPVLLLRDRVEAGLRRAARR